MSMPDTASYPPCLSPHFWPCSHHSTLLCSSSSCKAISSSSCTPPDRAKAVVVALGPIRSELEGPELEQKVSGGGASSNSLPHAHPHPPSPMSPHSFSHTPEPVQGRQQFSFSSKPRMKAELPPAWGQYSNLDMTSLHPAPHPPCHLGEKPHLEFK